MSELYESLKTIYWEAGIWRKFSFEEFVNTLIEIKKQTCLSNQTTDGRAVSQTISLAL